MSRLLRSYERLLAAGLAAAGAMIAGMALMISLDVMLRVAGLPTLGWNVEVSEYILFLSTLLGAPWVLRQGAHVRVDVVVRGLPPAIGVWVDRAASLTGLMVSVVLAWYGASAAAQAFRLQSLIFKQLVVPEWPFLAVTPVVALLLAVEFGLRLIAPGAPPLAARKEGF